MAKEWTNWAGDQRCVPARIEAPSGRGDLMESVKRAVDDGLPVRAAGAGHSFTDAACTGGLMLDLSRLNRVLDVDQGAGLVRVEGGIGLRELNETIWGYGLALENLGDIDRQSVAGAVSTATHGTGSRFRNLSSLIEAVELVLPDGTMVEFSQASDPDELRAARVSLGALGVIATMTLRTVPAFTIRRVDSQIALEEAIDRIDDLADGSDHFEFYVFPHTDRALLRQSERTDDEPKPRNRAIEYGTEVMIENWVFGAVSRMGRRSPSRVPALSRFVSSKIGNSTKQDRSYRVYASQRRVRFTEMEYAIPRRNCAEAVQRILDAAERSAPPVGFPIEVRFVAGDDAMLSPAHERDTCYVAVHQYEGVPWEGYFRSVEGVMEDYGGRPHWGKRHFQTAATLAERYPRWGDFAALRARLDPEGSFRNAYTDRVLGPVATP
ncbi:MAG: FAD-binding protein [Solirubrobacterales bacterium]|nr:FAD-binding protein [Solirubrobacterales bacterium]